MLQTSQDTLDKFQLWHSQKMVILSSILNVPRSTDLLNFLLGYYLATATDDCCVKLWDLRKLKNFKTLQLDDGYEVRDLSFDSSGSYLAVAGSDVRVYLCKQWDSLKVTFSFYHRNLRIIGFHIRESLFDIITTVY